jgi:hypothetical protein
MLNLYLCNSHIKLQNSILELPKIYYYPFWQMRGVTTIPALLLMSLHISRLVESKYAETAGTMMAYFLSLGLGIGAATSFGITKSI